MERAAGGNDAHLDVLLGRAMQPSEQTIAKAMAKLFRAEEGSWVALGVGILVWLADLDGIQYFRKAGSLHIHRSHR
eukprot:6198826-Pleurochrysis_carterae.AAC.3